jgi:hypothetical protein
VQEGILVTDFFTVEDGVKELKSEMSLIVDIIVRTAKWVHPDTFRALPVWYPETARKLPLYDAKWVSVYKNKNRVTALVSEKVEPNIRAGKAFIAALGVKKTSNWTVCHIWGVDDPKFQRNNTVVGSRMYYSCVANMVWLPTPLKGFTDSVPEIKQMLRTCSFYLYGWACEHPDVQKQADEIRGGLIPDGYPKEWPAPGRSSLPPGTAPFTSRVAKAIKKRKDELKRLLADESLVHFPRTEVLDVLDKWKIEL